MWPKAQVTSFKCAPSACACVTTFLPTSQSAKNSAENGFLTEMSNHNGTHTKQIYTNLAIALNDAKGDKQAVLTVLEHFKNLVNGWL